MRACLTIGETQITLSDEPASLPLQGFALAIQLQDAQRATRMFDALTEGGTVILPLQKTPSAEAFGIVRDKFGVNWMFNSAE